MQPAAGCKRRARQRMWWRAPRRLIVQQHSQPIATAEHGISPAQAGASQLARSLLSLNFSLRHMGSRRLQAVYNTCSERELEMETAGVSGNLRWALTPAALQFQAPPWLHMLKTTASGRPHITARSLDCIGWLCTKKRKRTSRHLPVSLSQLVNCLSRIHW